MGANDSALSKLCASDRPNDTEVNTEVVRVGQSTARHKQTSKSKHDKNYSHIEKELSNAMKEIQRMKQLHEFKANEINTRYSMLNDKYTIERDQKSKLQQQIQESTTKYSQYEQQMQKYRARASESQKQVIESLKLENEHQNELSQYKMSNMRLQQQLNQSNNYKSEHNKLQNENNKLQTIKSTLETEIIKLNQIITEISNQNRTLKSENNKLSKTLEELTEKLELKSIEFDEYKQKSIVSHRTSIINEQIIIATLKNQISNLEIKLTDNERDIDILPSITEQKDNTSYDTINTMSDIDKYEMDAESNDSELIMDSTDKILPTEKDTTVAQQRVLHTLEKSRTVTDVAKLVMEQYKTMDGDDEIIGSIHEEEEESYDENDDDESSLEEHEKLEIQRMKSLKNIQKGMDDEAEAMQKEMEIMKMQMENSMKKEMLAMQTNLNSMKQVNVNVQDDVKSNDEMNDNLGSVDGKDDDDESDCSSNSNSQNTTHEIGSVSISVSENEDNTPIPVEDEMMKSPKNLFRYRSMVKWDQIELEKQKKEMVGQMIHLVEHHNSTLKVNDGVLKGNGSMVVDNKNNNNNNDVEVENKSDEQ